MKRDKYFQRRGTDLQCKYEAKIDREKRQRETEKRGTDLQSKEEAQILREEAQIYRAKMRHRYSTNKSGTYVYMREDLIKNVL